MKKILFIFAFLLLGATTVEAQLISYSQTTRIKQKKKIKPVEPGYQQTIALTTSLGSNYEYFPVGVVYEGGYRFNNTFYLGVGVGYEYYIDTPYANGGFSTKYNNYTCEKCPMGEFAVPVYATMRVYLSKKRFQPYCSIMLGSKLAPKEEIYIYTGYKELTQKYSPFPYLVEPGVGFDLRLTEKLAINMYVGCLVLGEPMFEGDKLRGKIYYEPFTAINARLGVTF